MARSHKCLPSKGSGFGLILMEHVLQDFCLKKTRMTRIDFARHSRLLKLAADVTMDFRSGVFLTPHLLTPHLLTLPWVDSLSSHIIQFWYCFSLRVPDISNERKQRSLQKSYVRSHPTASFPKESTSRKLCPFSLYTVSDLLDVWAFLECKASKEFFCYGPDRCCLQPVKRERGRERAVGESLLYRQICWIALFLSSTVLGRYAKNK